MLLQTAIVTVEDQIAPVVLTKNITIQLNTAGTASIVVADKQWLNDGCGIVSLTLDKTSFSCSNVVGLNTVTLKLLILMHFASNGNRNS
jgi:hypothetical protein